MIKMESHTKTQEEWERFGKSRGYQIFPKNERENALVSDCRGFSSEFFRFRPDLVFKVMKRLIPFWIVSGSTIQLEPALQSEMLAGYIATSRMRYLEPWVLHTQPCLVPLWGGRRDFKTEDEVAQRWPLVRPVARSPYGSGTPFIRIPSDRWIEIDRLEDLPEYRPTKIFSGVA
jgi:hypothetical protein